MYSSLALICSMPVPLRLEAGSTTVLALAAAPSLSCSRRTISSDRLLMRAFLSSSWAIMRATASLYWLMRPFFSWITRS